MVLCPRKTMPVDVYLTVTAHGYQQLDIPMNILMLLVDLLFFPSLCQQF